MKREAFDITNKIYLTITLGLIVAENLIAFEFVGVSSRRILHVLITTIIICYFLYNKDIFNVRKIRIKFDHPAVIFIIILLYLFIVTLVRLPGIDAVDYLFLIKRLIHATMLGVVFICIFVVAKNLTKVELRFLTSILLIITSIICFIYIADYILYQFENDFIIRNAIGTDGEPIKVQLTYYQNHRLLGGFKEPSHLGAFLLPLAGLAYLSRSFILVSVLVGALWLTLSILIWIGLFVLLVIATIFFFVNDARNASIKFTLGLLLASC